MDASKIVEIKSSAKPVANFIIFVAGATTIISKMLTEYALFLQQRIGGKIVEIKFKKRNLLKKQILQNQTLLKNHLLLKLLAVKNNKECLKKYSSALQEELQPIKL